MPVTSLRPHRRFAVRQKVRIAHSAGHYAEGLLIELSIRGCRISNSDQTVFANGDPVTLEIGGFAPIHAAVRLADKSVLCLNFVEPLYTPALDRLIDQCRTATAHGPAVLRHAVRA